MTATATYLGANGWCLDVAGLRVLVDPWLFGPLVFPPGPWLLKGEMIPMLGDLPFPSYSSNKLSSFSSVT